MPEPVLLTDSDRDLVPHTGFFHAVLVDIWQGVYNDLGPSPPGTPVTSVVSARCISGLSTSIPSDAQGSAPSHPNGEEESGHLVSREVGGGVFCRKCAAFCSNPSTAG